MSITVQEISSNMYQGGLYEYYCSNMEEITCSKVDFMSITVQTWRKLLVPRWTL